MNKKAKRRFAIAKLTLTVFLVYLFINWVWIYVKTLSNAQQINDFQRVDDDGPGNMKNNAEEVGDDDDDVTLAVLDANLESAVGRIESDAEVNSRHHPYIINNDQLCSDSIQGGLAPGEPVTRRRIFLLVYVHSAPEHYVQRLLLRQTWANPRLYDLNIRVAFFIGRRSGDNLLGQAVRLEAAQFGDIIQADFEDAYRNLTLKAMSALSWIRRYCNRTLYVLKTDDDAYVNMRSLLRHIGDLHQQRAQRRTGRLILCRIWSDMPVLRTDPKWAVSRSDFPADVYPPYCSGIALVLSIDMVLAFARVASRVAFFWVDDVFLTGLIPARLSKAGVSITWAEFGHAYIRMDKMETFDSPLWYRYVFVHLAEMNYFARMWTRMEEAAKRYPIPKVAKVVPGHIAGHNWTDT